MGALLGLLAGVGLLLCWQAVAEPPPAVRRPPAWRARVQDALAAAGLGTVRPVQLGLVCAGAAAVAGLAALATSRSVAVSAAFAVIAGRLPWAAVRGRARRRGAELREAWPEAVDHLASGVRAGLSLAEALAQLSSRGPEPLRPAFGAFASAHRASGRLDDCLDALRDALADPVGDRVVASLRLAREVGGSDLGRLLRTLSAFLREDARTRAEVEARQSWTVNAARLALVAPWVMLAMLALRPEAVRAYDTPAGAVVLAAGGGVSLVAYRLMLRLGRLPVERRVLR